MKSYELFIDGHDVAGAGWTYAVHASSWIDDPKRAFNLKRALELGNETDTPSDVVGRCAWGTDDHTDRALAAAATAARGFGQVSLDERIAILRDFYEVLKERAPELVDLLIAEGHPRQLAAWEVTGMLRGCDGHTLNWYRSQLRSERQVGERRIVLERRPDGVVCVNPPQNAAGSNGSLGLLALLAGNTLVVKAPRTTPLTVMFVYRELLAPILERREAPSGTLNLISGRTKPVLRRWLESPHSNTLVFFGDSSTGIKLGREWHAHDKKAVLELSGNDGLVVWRDADLDAAAKALTECFYGSSQICMVPKYAVVHPAIAGRFLTTFLQRVASIRPAKPDEDEALLSPVLKSDRYFDFLSEAREAGCPILTGGRRVNVDGEPTIDGLFIEPTVVRVDGLDHARELACVREETFFPLLPIVVPHETADDAMLDAVIEFLNANEYGLRNSVFASGEDVLERFAAGITNGGLLKINDSHIGFAPSLATHGGNGLTGGPFGELNYVGIRTSRLQGISWGTGVIEPFDEIAEPTSTAA